MSKRSKRRNKTYKGEDAKIQGPVVHHYKAEVRGPVKEWWLDHKKPIKWGVGIGGGVAIIIWLVAESIRLLAS